MTAVYQSLIIEAAVRLVATMRGAAIEGWQGEVSVWAIHTKPGAPGRLHVGRQPPEGVELGGYEDVRPAGYGQWSLTPYSAMASALYHACRSVPILPID